jgi:hypothetical protein
LGRTAPVCEESVAEKRALYMHESLTGLIWREDLQVIDGLKQAAKTTAAAGQAVRETGELMNQALSFSDPFIEMTSSLQFDLLPVLVHPANPLNRGGHRRSFTRPNRYLGNTTFQPRG